MAIKKKTKLKAEIPTSSMPDIIFMLLIFFMMTTTMRQFEGLKVILPQARKIEKVETKRHVSYIFVGRDGVISVDDKLIQVNDVRKVMYSKRVADPQLIVSIRADRNVQMGVISQIHNELREADALRVNYSATTANY
ncbi:MAG: biopolymer transporter ExbD [Candidatus Neomarinimicrobiota bacterium]|nr:biopolymer transporter ExbD [Candidatus Neomarinimicrobiota bacterium]RKY51491.1 MAG: biopolymer transporter ExbD [Candidatus Neomarinimicrobiota bacterium]